MEKKSYFSYDRHESEWQKVLDDPARNAVGETWQSNDTLDAWRHDRMREPIKPIVAADPGASWLTVGDGRYGSDARYLAACGAANVHASDISDKLLKIAAEKKLIEAYSEQNAELLTFEDDSFDYVYCKESFHHFPRPYIALDQMFRVARKGVILTEPRDLSIDQPAYEKRKWKISRLFRKKKKPVYKSKNHTFEPVGNYVYSLSEREVEKFALGIHRNLVAFIGCNDAYREGIEFVKLNSTDEKDLAAINEVKSAINAMDEACEAGKKRTKLLTAMIFKDAPSSALIDAMRRADWDVRELPLNPYL